MSFSWFCPECKACLTLWESRISCLSLCFPNATAPLVTIIISLPWFCSMATWQGYIKAITLKDFFHNQDQEPTHYYSHTAIINRVLILCASTIFSWDITCSTMEASRPSARPHSSRVTTALPSFTTIRLACFSSLRWTKDFPWGRGSETARKNKVTFNYTSACKNLQFSIRINKDGENIFYFRQDDKSRLAAYI